MAIINGSTLNDILFGTTGTDTINGNGGDDLINPHIGLNDFIDGGAGIDTLFVNYSNLISDANFSFVNMERISVLGGSGNDIFVFNNTIDTLDGGDGNDTLDAGALDDNLFGRNGDDKLFGREGNDRLTGEGGSDFLDGDVGNDYMEGGDNNDTLYGWLGNDTLIGGEGADHMDGQQDSDFLFGNGGNDTLIAGGDVANDFLFGGAGFDYLAGGPGADRFAFVDLFFGDIDFIADFNSSEGDKIQIQRSGFGASSINQFTYNINTGALFFLNTQFATLQSGAAFTPSLDIVLYE
jgi:serralysin